VRTCQPELTCALPLTPPVLLLCVAAYCAQRSAASVNSGLLRCAQASLPPGVTMELLSCRLPLYDGDLEAAGVPPEVAAFRAKARTRCAASSWAGGLRCA
jgi:hypothetical protein